jgi:hypothetical protein
MPINDYHREADDICARIDEAEARVRKAIAKDWLLYETLMVPKASSPGQYHLRNAKVGERLLLTLLKARTDLEGSI